MVVTLAGTVVGESRWRNDRNRTVVTISTAGTTLMATGSTSSEPRSIDGESRAKIVAITTAAAPGLGSPMK